MPRQGPCAAGHRLQPRRVRGYTRRMTDRRALIVSAAIEIVGEEGYPALTQPRVAARAGIRQSALTYYFPTRSDLLAAVADSLVDGLLAAFDAAGPPTTADQAARMIATLTGDTTRTRKLLAVILAADNEPGARAALQRLIGGMRGRGVGLLAALGSDPDTRQVDAQVLHGVSVGLAIAAFAMRETAADGEGEAIVARALHLLTAPNPPHPSH